MFPILKKIQQFTLLRKVICKVQYRFKQVNAVIKNTKSDAIPVSMSYRLYRLLQPNQAEKPAQSLIVIHGLYGSKKNWRSMASRLNRRLELDVYTVDVRNHCDSPKSEYHSYEHLAEDINLFLEERNLKSAVPVGHSMGGKAAMTFALKYPQKVDSLVIADIAPVDRIEDLPAHVEILDAIESVHFDNNIKDLHTARRSAFKQIVAKLNNGFLANFLLMQLYEIEPRKFAWQLNTASLRKNLEHIMRFPKINATFNKPTLFIYGKLENYVLPKDHDTIKKYFPHAEYVGLKTGHMVHVEEPQQFLEKVSDFIEKSNPN